MQIAPAPTELAATGSAGAPSGAVAGTAAGLLVALMLVTLIGLTLRERVAEQRLSSLLWSSNVHRPG